MLYVSQLRLQFLARLAGTGAVWLSAVKLLFGALSQANTTSKGLMQARAVGKLDKLC